ncbi:hypothetical protein [Pseudarthrobacter siccitolerans]
MHNPFISYRQRYWQNVRGSELTHARAAIFETPDGGKEQGVVIFRDRYMLTILTVEDATRVADQIIDAIERPAL